MKPNACLLTFLILLPINSIAQKSVLTQHNDLNRSGWNDKETILKKSNVTPNTFGKLFTRAVDDQVYAQPLVKLQINMPGKGLKNVVYVATVNNSVYAFDADSANESTAFWQVNLTVSGTRPVNKGDMTGACGGFYNDFSGNMGIVGTPVIDTTTNTLYVVARSLKTSTNTYYQYLHALDITTGAEKVNSPVLITATVNGTGDGSVRGKVNFDAQKQNQRPGLLLLNGIVYIAWSSHCDWGPYHGWVMGYDKTSLLQKYVYNTTPDGYWGGIWMSGGGPSADENGNIYLAAGNGSVGKNGNPADVTNRSESALKLTPSLTLSSFFTPKNYETLEGADLDFGVTQMLLIPNTNRAIVGVKDAVTGDTLCQEGTVMYLESIDIPAPVISASVEPKNKADYEKMVLTLKKLMQEDPSFRFSYNEETGQTVIEGMGELHLEIKVDLLKRDHKIDVVQGKLQVAYKETIQKPVEVEGKFIRQSGGRGQYGHVWLKLEPMERGKGFEFVNGIVGGSVPREYIPAVEKGLEEAITSGVLGGYPVVDLKATLYDGSYHDVDSSEMAFKIAASMAFKSGMTKASPVLLEPIMKVEVETPEEYMGDVMGGLSSKRGKIQGMEMRGGNQVINAEVPLGEMFGYATELRSMTKGRATYTMEFANYSEAPKNIEEAVVKNK